MTELREHVSPATAGKPRARWGRRLDALLVAGFVAALAAPHVDHLLRPDEARDPRPEKRFPARRPTFTLEPEALAAFPSAYEAHWNDTFGLRDRLLELHARLLAGVLRTSPSARYVLGPNDWLFYAGEHAMDAWRGARPFPPGELAAWAALLEERRALCESLGARYLWVVAPDKASIHPEELPWRLEAHAPSRLDEWLAHVRTRTSVDVLDLRPALREAAAAAPAGEPLYYELGTHWRARGTIAAQQAILEHLRGTLPLPPPRTLADHVPEAADPLEDDESGTLYLDGMLAQPRHRLVPSAPLAFEVMERSGAPRRVVTRGPDPQAPSAVVFHDSFGPSLEPYLAAAFSRLVMCWDRPFDPALIARERPDVVLDLYVERALARPVPRSTASPDDPLAEAFERATDVRFRLDLETPQQGFSPLFRARPSLERDDAGPFVAVTVEGAPDAVVLPPFPVADARRLLVRIDVTAPAPTTLALHYRLEEDPTYLPERRVEAPLRGGRQRVVLALDPRGLAGALVLVPGAVAGRYELREWEARAED